MIKLNIKYLKYAVEVAFLAIMMLVVWRFRLWEYTLLVLVDFVFIGLTHINNINSNDSLLGIFLSYVLRIFSINSLIMGFDILGNLDTCSYDVILRFLLSTSYVFFFFSNLTGAMTLNLFFKRVISVFKILFASAVTLFFVFGFLKLFFVKYTIIFIVFSFFALYPLIALISNSIKNDFSK